MTASEKNITFVQYDIPKLRAGEYTIDATLDTTLPTSSGKQTAQYGASRTFAVAGLRFRLGGDDLVSVFPPNLAVGSFEGVLPHVVLNRSTLPWSRTADRHSESTSWLAVLTVLDGELPLPDGQRTLVTTVKIADLIAQHQPISIAGVGASDVLAAMPQGTISYPNLQQLDYGENPNDSVNVIDLPVGFFSRIAPTADDLALLAHVRQTDAYDSADGTATSIVRSIVLGNRMAAVGVGATAFLVSLENMSAFLPDDEGNPAPALANAQTIRLTVLTSWSYQSNGNDAELQKLLEGLNQSSAGGLSSLRMVSAAASSSDVVLATANEPAGLCATDANALVANALAAGYVPLDHHLREAGKTVSWFRGPMLPHDTVAQHIAIPAPGPDALLRYDPNTGMFDVSYAAAWQLGQMLGLRSRAYSVALHRWRKQWVRASSVQQTTSLLERKLTSKTPACDAAGPIFPGLLARHQVSAALVPPVLPSAVIDFLGGLRLLRGVPFNYLVPDEGMLPMESLRLFALDPNWIDALVDGAFGIGRTSAADLANDVDHISAMEPLLVATARANRSNDRPALARLKATPPSTLRPQITGILIRSQVVRDWPKLQINAYSTTDASQESEVPKLRMQHLSKDVLLCLFDGAVKMIAIHEPPEQLHSGVELSQTGASTSVRQVNISTSGYPGYQYPGVAAQIALRQDGLTLQTAKAAASVQAALGAQGQKLNALLANQFALQLAKGVVRVNFIVG